MTGEHRTRHLVPAGPRWICYGRLTWGGTRLRWGCTEERGTALGQDFQSGSVSFLLHPFPSRSGYGWDCIVVPANRLRMRASWCQGKGERGRRYLGVDNRDNHRCRKGSIWDIILFCLTGARSVSLIGFVPPLALAPNSNLLLLPSLLPALAIPLALFLLFWSKSGCWQPAIQSQRTSEMPFYLVFSIASGAHWI